MSQHSQAQYPENFFVQSEPQHFPEAKTIFVNSPLAIRLGFDPEFLATEKGTQALIQERSLFWKDPAIALAYAGHQFGHFAMLGDGRAHMMGRVHLPTDNMSVDVQLKGSGQTPFSRRGDGRAALEPMLREYLISEYMHAVGIPTTQILAVIATGEEVHRDESRPGAIAVRVARSHLRVGTFEFAAASGELDSLVALTKFAARELAIPLAGYEATSEEGLLEFLKCVVDRQAQLIAQWMSVGFVHGVMNTDNMALSGETIDFGPCGFMNRTHPQTVFSSIDSSGRYAYGAQPAIAKWNLSRFAECLLTLIAFKVVDRKPSEATIGRFRAVIDSFDGAFQTAWYQLLWHKLGFSDATPPQGDFIQSLLRLLTQAQVDWTDFFVGLEVSVAQRSTGSRSQPGQTKGELEQWQSDWLKIHLSSGATHKQIIEALEATNPKIVPRNQRVEDVLRSVAGELTASDSHRFQKERFIQAIDDLSRPFQTLDQSVELRRRWSLTS